MVRRRGIWTDANPAKLAILRLRSCVSPPM